MRPFDRATAAQQGVTPARLRAVDVSRPFRGVQTVSPPQTVAAAAVAYSVRMQAGECFSHATAAVLQSLPLPASVQHLDRIDVSAVHPAGAPVAAGVRGHRLRYEPMLDPRFDLPVVTAAEAWCQLAATTSLTDLTVIADVLVNRIGDFDVARAALAERATAYNRPAQKRLLRVLEIMRLGSASPGETRARLVCHFGGLPEPELNGIIDGRRGEALGHGDLVWRARRVVAEYEGDGHRVSVSQFRYDIERYERFRDAGWTVVRITADHLREDASPLLIERLRRLIGD